MGKFKSSIFDGNVILKNNNPHIIFDMSDKTNDMFFIKAKRPDGYLYPILQGKLQYRDSNFVGANVFLGGNEKTIISAGECVNNNMDIFFQMTDTETNQDIEDTWESIHMIADKDIYFNSGGGRGVTTGGTLNNIIGMILNSSQELLPIKQFTPTDNIGSIGNSSYRWASAHFTNLYSSTIRVENEIINKSNKADLTLADNGLTEVIYPSNNSFIDKNSRIMGRNEMVIRPNGNVEGFWYVRNYATTSSNVDDYIAQKGIRIVMDKSGNLTYNISDNANFRSAINAVNKAGDTLTGNLSYNMYGKTDTPLKVYGGDGNGLGISVGAGGATIVGAGESAKAFESLIGATTEDLHLAADGKINFYSQCNSIGNRIGMYYSEYGNLCPMTTKIGQLGTEANTWNKLYVNEGYGKWCGSVSADTLNTTDTWIPVIKSGKLEHTLRDMPTAVCSSRYNTNQGYLATLGTLSWWNGAYNTGNNSNLKYCSQGEIQAKPKILYDNANGASGNITLNETAANFARIEVYTINSDNKTQAHCPTTIFNPNNKGFRIQSIEGGDARMFVSTKEYKISGTSISVAKAQQVGTLFASGSFTVANYQNICITRVLGYK